MGGFRELADLAQVLFSCRREDALPQPPYVLLDLAPGDQRPSSKPSSGPFLRPDSAAEGSAVNAVTVMMPSHDAQLALRFRWLAASSPHRLTWSRQHPFGSGLRPYPAGSPGRAAATPRETGPGFPVAFRRNRHSLLDHPFPPQDRPSSRLAHRATRPDSDGVSTFRTCEIRPGWVPSMPRGRWCPPDRRFSRPTGTRRFPAASPYTLLELPPAGLKRDEASTRVHSRSPVRSSPCLWPTDETQTLGRLP